MKNVPCLTSERKCSGAKTASCFDGWWPLSPSVTHGTRNKSYIIQWKREFKSLIKGKEKKLTLAKTTGTTLQLRVFTDHEAEERNRSADP